jgi:hypothetical protein
MGARLRQRIPQPPTSALQAHEVGFPTKELWSWMK